MCIRDRNVSGEGSDKNGEAFISKAELSKKRDCKEKRLSGKERKSFGGGRWFWTRDYGLRWREGASEGGFWLKGREGVLDGDSRLR